MSQPALRRMSSEEFFDWQSRQDRLYELIDGVPVGMVGARLGHDIIVVNTVREVANQLRDSPCRPFTEAVAVRIPAGNIRRPGVSVACGPFDPQATAERQPKLIIEVLSPSTRGLDQFRKLDEYKTVEGLIYILLIDPDVAEIILWSREVGQNWQSSTVAGLDAAVDLPALGLVLRMADLYEGMPVRPVPRLVREEP